jgi:two-component system chemotaxis response regulator CheY
MARILIVDDSLVSRTILRGILSKRSHEVVGEAEDGDDGLKKFLALRPDMVTMDITMPGTNGIVCLKAILARDPQAKVMIVSALDHEAEILEALQAGARHCVIKPFEPEQILKAVSEVMSE